MDLDNEIMEPRGNKTSGGRGELPNATAILVLGIISIVICIFYGIPGMVCGIIALALYPKSKKLYESNPSYYEQSYKNAQAGFICAIIGVSLSVLSVIIFIAAFATNNFGQGFDL